MWTVRHYNGRIYQAGMHASKSIDAIHPDQVVRFDANMSKGEVTVSIDGRTQAGAPHFTGLKGKTIYPAVTAYGSEVSIRFKSFKKKGAVASGGRSGHFHRLVAGALPLAVGDVKSSRFAGKLGSMAGQGYGKTKLAVAGSKMEYGFSLWPGAGGTANGKGNRGTASASASASAAGGAGLSESKGDEEDADPMAALAGVDVGLEEAYARWDMGQVLQAAEEQVKEAKKKAKKQGGKDDDKKDGKSKGKGKGKAKGKPTVTAVPSNIGVLYLQFALDDSTQKTAIPVSVDVIVDGHLVARSKPMVPECKPAHKMSFGGNELGSDHSRPEAVDPVKVPQIFRVAVTKTSTVELRARVVPEARRQTAAAVDAGIGKR